jgi:hypothetical protein
MENVEDVVIYNTRIKNNTDSLLPISINDSRPNYVISRAGSYYLILDSFVIDDEAIPIFDYDPNEYYVEYGAGYVDRVTVPFYQLYDFDSIGVYSISQFLRMMDGLVVGAHTLNISYSNVTKTISLTVTTTTDEPATSFRLSNRLGLMFKNLYLKDNNDWFNVLIRNRAWIMDIPAIDNDTVTYIEESPNLASWTDIEGLLISTANLPINFEQFSNIRETSGTIFKVINDFVIFKTPDVVFDRTPLTYVSDYPKLIDMKGDREINSVDLIVYALKTNGDFKIIQLLPGCEAVFKLRFMRKEFYNSNYSRLKKD